MNNKNTDRDFSLDVCSDCREQFLWLNLLTVVPLDGVRQRLCHDCYDKMRAATSILTRKEKCCVCDDTIFAMAYVGTGVCCDQCRRVKTGELEFAYTDGIRRWFSLPRKVEYDPGSSDPALD